MVDAAHVRCREVSILAGGLAGWQRDEWLLREGEEAYEGGEF